LIAIGFFAIAKVFWPGTDMASRVAINPFLGVAWHMKMFRKATAFLDHMNDYATALTGAIVIFMMLLITADIVLRYFFNRTIEWTLDISEILLLYIPFLTAAWVLKNDGHIRVDILYNVFSPKCRGVLNLLNSILGMMIFLFITWYGAQVTSDLLSKHVMELRLGIPTFAIIVIIPIGSFLLFLQYLKLTVHLFSKQIQASLSKSNTKSDSEKRDC
jgi:C4-dicarboxylate transporter DctQ subunit